VRRQPVDQPAFGLGRSAEQHEDAIAEHEGAADARQFQRFRFGEVAQVARVDAGAQQQRPHIRLPRLSGQRHAEHLADADGAGSGRNIGSHGASRSRCSVDRPVVLTIGRPEPRARSMTLQ
jgi:hypothetical protein